MKRILALLLCLALCLSLLPASFAADIEIIDPEEMEEMLPEEEIALVEPADEPKAAPAPDAEPTSEIIASGECGDNLTWTLDDEGTLIIDGTGDMWDYEGYETYRFPSWSGYAESIKTIIINEGVTSIGSNFFTYHGSDEKYNKNQFIALSRIIFRGSAPTFRDNCFRGDVYAAAYYPEGDPSWTSSVMQDYGGHLTWVPYSGDVVGPTVIASGNCGEGRYDNCGDNLTWELDDEGKLVISGSGEMCYCNGSIEYDDEWDAPWFRFRLYVKSVTIDPGATSISGYAFMYFKQIWSITIPNSVTSIGRCAFYSCSSLTNVYYNGYKELAEKYKGNGWSTNGNDPLFNATWTYAKTLEEGWEFCGNDLLWQYDSNTRTVKIKGDGPMWDFNGETPPWSEYRGKLVGVSFEPGVTRIGSYAFYGCEKLREITIPEGVTCIGECAFYNCNAMTAVTLPDGLTDIENSAFYNCSGLTAVSIPSGVTHISDVAFGSCSGLTSVTLPEGLVSIGYSAFAYCSGLESLTIPQSVTGIGSYAFYGCGNLRSIRIPDGVTRVESSTFANCSNLTSVDFGSGVTSIDSSAFASCVSLTDLALPAGLTSLGGSAFSGCTALSSVTIPESLTSISASVFSGCSGLRSMTIPTNITNIGSYAFGGCRSLKTVDFLGGPPNIASNSFSGVNATCWYPDDGSWWEDDMEDYGGHLVWVPRGETLYLSDGSISVAVFDNRSLTLSRADGTAVYAEWSTSDANVARVDDRGQVEGIKYGKCTISASTGGQIYSCEVQTLFWDVADPSQYYFKHVYWAAENGITKGYDLEYFDPQGECTREQMMTFLWRLAGQPNPTTTTSRFPDVKSGAYYYKAVLWGVEKGITNGYSSGPLAGKFGVGEACTREQAMTFLWRMAGKPDPTGTTNKFKDVKKSDYFYKAVLWASENKIANGYADGTYGVGKACLREHMVTFLSKYDAKFGNH